MDTLTFRKAVTVDESALLERVLRRLDEAGVRFCVIGGQAVNAYSDAPYPATPRPPRPAKVPTPHHHGRQRRYRLAAAGYTCWAGNLPAGPSRSTRGVRGRAGGAIPRSSQVADRNTTAHR